MWNFWSTQLPGRGRCRGNITGTATAGTSGITGMMIKAVADNQDHPLNFSRLRIKTPTLTELRRGGTGEQALAEDLESQGWLFKCWA